MFIRVNWVFHRARRSTKEYATMYPGSRPTRTLLTQSQRVEHAGYQREIISRNPALIDEDGYEVDSDDDDERAQQAAVSAAEMDPYADIRLERKLS